MRDDGTTVAKKLTALKTASEYGSYGALSRALGELGVSVTDQTLTHYHAGHTSNGHPTRPETMRLDVMIGLAVLYSTSLSKISPKVAARADRESNRVLRQADLFASYAAWDSNPEPTDYGLLGQMTLIAA